MNPDTYRNRHQGADIYVLGSGPTLNHIPTRFWRNKLIVTANDGAIRTLDRPPDYMVTKYHEAAHQYLRTHPQATVVVTRHNTGNHREPALPDHPHMVILDHPHNTIDKWTPDQWPSQGQYLATWSTITTAMHWAAHLGASNLILAGHDCGWIDNIGRIPGHRTTPDGREAGDTDSQWWQAWDQQTRKVKAELEARYGCTITSVNPWINLHLEGHTWRATR